MSDKKFIIKKKGDTFKAFDTEDKTCSYGTINIKTGKCVGATLCFDALTKHLAEYKGKAKKTYKIWMVIEEHIEYPNGTEDFKDLKEETRSCGMFDTLDEATEQMNEIGEQYEGDFTK